MDMSTRNGDLSVQANDVATYLISLVRPEEGDVITHLKLQKLMYYAQAYALALLGRPLFAEPIVRWQHGPVVTSVYHTHKALGSAPLLPGTHQSVVHLDPKQRIVLNGVFAVYGRYEASALRNMTHREAPWLLTADGGVITTTSIESYFRGVLSGTVPTSDQRRKNALTVAYLAGVIDAADVARELGLDVAKVIVMFEEAGLARSLETTALDDVERDILESVLQTAMRDPEAYDTPQWIGREVIASQRIEDVDARAQVRELLAHGS